MAYTVTNYRSAKAIRDDFKAGKLIEVYQPNAVVPGLPKEGAAVIEGPHYPEPHRFYLQVELARRDGKMVIVKIKR